MSNAESGNTYEVEAGICPGFGLNQIGKLHPPHPATSRTKLQLRHIADQKKERERKRSIRNEHLIHISSGNLHEIHIIFFQLLAMGIQGHVFSSVSSSQKVRHYHRFARTSSHTPTQKATLMLK